MKRNRALLALLVVHVALTGALALANPHALLLDDAYYSLTVARNLATGQGFSYGGFPTNGVQPLYSFLMAPVMAALGDQPELCLRLALLLMIACSAGLLVVLYRLTERLVDSTAAVIAGALYVVNASLTAQIMSGLETPLHGLLFWGFVALYLRFRESDSAHAFAGLGLLLGLTAYARFDTVFLFVAVAVDLAKQDLRAPRRLVRRGLALFAPALALLAPWFIWCWLTFGTFVQSSGMFHRWRGLVRQDLPASVGGLATFAMAKVVSLVLKLPLVGLGWEGISRTLGAHWLGAQRPQTGLLIELLHQRPTIAVALLLVIALALVFVIRFGRSGLRQMRRLNPLAFLWPAVACAAVYYPLYQLNYSMRHFFPFNAGMVVVLGAFLSGVFARLSGAGVEKQSPPGSAAVRVVFVAALVFLTALPAISTWVRDADADVPRDRIAVIERVTEPGARIGYTDCGVYGYYVRGRTIVNLDGILNFEALREMQSGDIGAYLVRQHIDYVLYLQNFQAEFATQWQAFIASRVTLVPPTDWIYRVATEKGRPAGPEPRNPAPGTR